jgi:hypothetical protein
VSRREGRHEDTAAAGKILRCLNRVYPDLSIRTHPIFECAIHTRSRKAFPSAIHRHFLAFPEWQLTEITVELIYGFPEINPYKNCSSLFLNGLIALAYPLQCKTSGAI